MAVEQSVIIPGTSLTTVELASMLPGDVRGLLLYGSRARGTHKPDSDVDILQLSSSSGPTLHFGLLSVSRYDASSLRALMTRGSVFGRHLHNEAVLLWDPDGEFRQILDEFRDPYSYARTMSVIGLIGQTLALPHGTEHDRGVHRAAIYCARTALYISSIRAGDEHFDTSRIASTFGYEELERAKEEPGAWALAYLLDIVETLTNSDAEESLVLAPDFESAVTQLAIAYPDASQFLASLLSVRDDLPYSTLSLPFA
jgi:hypothetical protein